MSNIGIDGFELYLSWIVAVFRTQDAQVIRNFKQEVKTYLTPETLDQVLLQALQILAETEPETFRWALHHYDAVFYVELRRRVVVDAALQLIQQGFHPGRDFSAMPVGGLLITPAARAALNQQRSAFSTFLLLEILHTLKRV